MDARSTSDNPLGLNLDFLYGRGYLWAKDEHVSDWVTLRHLRMEIPDLTFPFDVRGGLDRFRDTRCLVRELELEISQVGLDELLHSAADDLEGFEDVEVRFLDGVALVSARVRAFGGSSFFTFRVAALRPEPADSDIIRLVPYDYRAYGRLPCPVRQLGHTFVSRLLQSEKVASLGAGTSFSIDAEGDALLVRPLKLMLLHVFTPHGWKLPNLSRVDVDEIGFRPGAARLRAVSDEDENWEGAASDVHGPELSRALAADEARRFFGTGDEQLFAGRAQQALATYQSFQERYRSHPGLVRRLLDVLLSDPNPANLAEAKALCDDLESDSVVAAMGRAHLAELDGDHPQIVAAYERLVEILGERGDTTDRALCEVVLANHVADDDPERAADRLTGVLREHPRNRPALDALRTIYERTNRTAELEDVLKRLTGVAPDEGALARTYLDLARHLMRQNEIGEARVFLERARRIAPGHFEVLDELAATWVLEGDAARAVKTLGSAAERAVDQGDPATASRLLFRVARLWNEALHNREQGLLQIRRAIELWDLGGRHDPLELARQLRYAAQLCEQGRHHSEAIAYWTEALAALQMAEARVTGDDRIEVRRGLAATHRSIAKAYRSRGRYDIAANHERRLIEMDPTDLEAVEALEEHHRSEDDLDGFADILRDAIERLGPNPESLELRLRLAELQVALRSTDDAIDTLEVALEVVPSSGRARRLLENLKHPDDAASSDFSREEATIKTTTLPGDDTDAPWKPGPKGIDWEHELETFELERTAPGDGGDEDSEPLDVPEPDEPSEPEELSEASEFAESNGEEPAAEDGRVASFRREFEQVTKRPPPLPDLDDLSDDSTLARVLRRKPTAVRSGFEEDEETVLRSALLPEKGDGSGSEEDERSTQEDAETSEPVDLGTLEEALEEARQSEDYAAIVDAIEALLGEAELSDTRRAALEYEVGELLYYDMEESDRALDHLLAVRRLDPDGYGARPGVLNAIEAIYEERGSVEGRIEILQARLAQAESRDMADTYRLLLAQLEWEAREDAEAVREWLEPIFEHDDRHEGAHRLLADVAEDQEEWEDAAEHLRIALSVAGDGLDSVELRRRMAGLLLDKLDDPKRALDHYKQVLEAAPGDSAALVAVRSCYAALGEWDSYIENLAEELRLLLGHTYDAEGGTEWLTELEPNGMPDALKAPASQILGDIADTVESELDDAERAHALWGAVVRLWPENVAGLERRIDLDRKLEHHDALADDLEEYAAMLLDADARFEALFESARLRTEILGDDARARELLREALAAAESLDEPPGELDAAHETLRGLEEAGAELPPK